MGACDAVGMGNPLGFYSRRRFIGFIGLIQPEVAAYHAHGDNVWVVKKYQPDYILAMPFRIETVGRDPCVQEHHSSLRTFERPDSDTAELLKRN
jgi:hypothetical protein